MRKLPLFFALIVLVPAVAGAQDSPSNFFDTSSVGTLSVRNGDVPRALSIERTSVKVEIVGRMARTEVTQVFRSHLPQQSEGEYRFTLPDGASVSRLAMDVEGRMMEGELHEKKRAREIYEGIVRRMKDPALLEWEGGNRFRTRIFPIPGRGTKTVILTYEQLLDGQRAHYSYRLPRLVGVDRDVALGRFEFTLTAWETGKIALETYPDATVSSRAGVERVELRRRDFVPEGPVVVSFPQIQSAARLLTAKVDGERFFLLDHTLEVPEAALEPRPLVFAVDTSASVGDAQLRRVKDVVRALAAAHSAPTCVVYGDLDTVTCSNDDGGACLDPVKAGGASDLAKLLSEAAGRARAYGRPATILLFSDGTPTLGVLDGQVLAAAAGRGAGPSVTIHTVAVGVDNDFGLLDAVAQAGGGRRDQLLPVGHDDAQRLATLLRTPVLRDVQVTVTSGRVEGLVPHLPRNLARGEPLAVLGRIEQGPVELEISGSYGGQQVHKKLTIAPQTKASHAVVRNFWARGVLETMETVGAPPERIVQTSLHYGVMSRFTSFLVLENEAAYAEHGVERRKVRRSDSSLASLVPGGNSTAVPALGNGDEGKMGSLGLGLRGTGGGGGGQSFGRIDTGGGRGVTGSLGSKRVRVPQIRLSSPVVMGSLDKNIIQRVLRQRLNAIRYCYERSLQRDPYLHGKIVVEWTIIENGTVGSASVKSSTLGDKEVETCIVRQIQRMRFPDVQGGGIVRVAYPFVFTGGDEQGHKSLERDQDTLDPTQRSLLLAHWLRTGKRKQALAYLNRSLALLKAPADRAALFHAALVREQFPKSFEATARVAVRALNPATWLAMALAILLEGRSADAVVEVFGPLNQLGPEAGSAVIDVLVEGRHPDAATRLVTRWRTSWEPAPLYAVVRGHAGDLPEAVFAVTQRLLAEQFDEMALRDHFAAATDPTTAAPMVARYCGTPPEDLMTWCSETLDAVGDGPDVVAAREQLLAALEKSLRQRRADDYDNDALIMEIATVLRRRGRPEAAARVLSELVEFSGTTAERRHAYATALAEASDLRGSCRELGTIAQLDPTRRDVFRQMMDLHRVGRLDAKDAEDCIVGGVVSLPARAEVTAVLTWEDSKADIDLRITEPLKEDVFYDHPRSVAGGLLYYDVRDGHGPEIYASPIRAKGKFTFQVVYYAGATKDVPARLTLIESPGTPAERRTVHDLILPAARSAVTVELTTR